MADALNERLAADLKTALRAGDEVRKTTLRGLLAALKKAADAKRRDAMLAEAKRRGLDLNKDTVTLDETAGALSETEMVAVIQREVKQRRESIAEFTKAGRADLIQNEEAELNVLEAYLPRQLSREEIEALAAEVIQATGATGPAQSGLVIKTVMARVKGQADGKLVSDTVRALLSRN